MFALLQSLCTAVLTISGIRVAIGLSALAAASGIYAPAKGWHQDAIRIPMLIVATIGARGESRCSRLDSPPAQSAVSAVAPSRTDPETKTLRAAPGRPRNHYAASGWS